MRSARAIVVLATLMAGLSGCGGMTTTIQSNSVCAEQRGRDLHWVAPDLVRAGNIYLENPSEADVTNAIICYSHALQLNPEDYGAHLGIAIANIMSARRTEQKEYINSARTHLALALAIRPFHFEVVYYLAELAMLEKKYELARDFLAPLLVTGYKKGPVNALLGDIYSNLGDSKKAREFYAIGAREGWPLATARYAQERAE